jgi:hypothetical protein
LENRTDYSIAPAARHELAPFTILFSPLCRKSPPKTALPGESKKRRLSQLKLKPKGARNYESQNKYKVWQLWGF